MTGIVLGICGAALFSAKPVLIKLAYTHAVSAEIVMTLRMAMSLPFYLVFALVALRQRRAAHTATNFSPATLAQTALIGLAGYYAASYLDLLGLTRITAQFERLILFTYPVFVALLSRLFLHHRLGTPTLAALVLTSTGLGVIFGHDFDSLGHDVTVGALQVLGASILFSGYVVFSKPMISRLGSRLFTCFAMIAASLAILTHFFITNTPSDLAVEKQVYGLVFLIAVFSTVLPTFMIAEAIARLTPAPASILGSVGPIFTSLLAVLMLGEAFTFAHLIGTVLIIAGIAAMGFYGTAKPPSARP